MTLDPETLLHAAVLLAHRAQGGEDVTLATERLARLAAGQQVAAFAESSSFTGEITDSIGRKRCYRDGKQVPCTGKEAAQAHRPHEGKRGHEGGTVGKYAPTGPTFRTHGLARIGAVAKLEKMAHDALTGKGGPPTGRVGKALSRAVGWIGHVLHGVEGVAKLTAKLAAMAIADEVDNAVDVLPRPLRWTVRASWVATKLAGMTAGKAGMALAFIAWTAQQKMVEQVAQEKGATAEEAKQIRGALYAVDMKTFEVLKVSTFAGVHAAHAPLMAMGLVSPTTTAYLVYNTAAHPVATWNAARALVGKVAALVPEQRLGGHVHDRLTPTFGEQDMGGDQAGQQSTDPQALTRTRLVADALEAHGWDDWYFALLMASLERTGNMAQAIQVADEAYRQQSESGVSEEDDSADAPA